MTGYVDRSLKTDLVFPFSVTSGDRIRAFTKDIEMAAILYLAESDREKHEGPILKKRDEKLVFVAEACYPIWLVPWGGGTLLFDGLGVSAHTLSYDAIPDVKAFSKNMQRSGRTPEVYSAALSRNAKYFKGFGRRREETIEGLIASPDLMQDFLVYLAEVEEAGKSSSKAVLSPAISKSEILASVEELSDLKAKVEEDVKNLKASMRLLGMTTRERLRRIRSETTEIRRKSDRGIEKARRGAIKKTRQLRLRYEERIRSMSKQFGRQLRLLHESRVKLKKTLTHVRVEVNRCEAKVKSCRRHKKKAGELRWTRRLKRIRRRLPRLEKNLRDANRKIAKIETARKLEISEQRMERDDRIEEVRKILSELGASREAGIRTKRQRAALLEHATSEIMNQLSEMVKLKRAALNQFGKILIPKRKKVPTLVYLPLYVARYERGSKKRYAVYPPSVVGSMGILTRMKGALGAAKMKALLQPRSKAVTTFLNQLVTLIHKNPAFERELTEAGIQNSILRRKKLRIGVKRGLKELKDENWISKDELQSFSKLLYIYA